MLVGVTFERGLNWSDNCLKVKQLSYFAFLLSFYVGE